MLIAFVAWALLRSATVASASATEIPITLYTDHNCDDPSTTASNITLNIGVCVVTPGLGSFDLQSFPCSSGEVQNYVFQDTACGQISSEYYRTGEDGHCFAAYQGDMAAIMLSCEQETPEQPISTTTIVVGAVATAASPTSVSTSPTASGSGGDGSSSSGSGTGSGSGSSSTSAATGWNSLDLGTRIGIIISLAVGIPPILLGLYTIRQRRKKQQQQQQQQKMEEDAQTHSTPMPTYPPPYVQGGGAQGYFSQPPGKGFPRPPPTMAEHQHNWAGYIHMTQGGGGGA